MIRTRRLEKRYGTFQALHPLDLHVEPGEVFGFLGPNGAGKTTTIRLLSGILPPTAGAVTIGGVDMAADPVGAKAQIGYGQTGRTIDQGTPTATHPLVQIVVTVPCFVLGHEYTSAPVLPRSEERGLDTVAMVIIIR